MQGSRRIYKTRKSGERTKRHLAANNRRGARFSAYGRELERKLEEMLARMQEEGTITSFVRHEPNSAEDAAGKDFSIILGEDEGAVTVSFGVTISQKSWDEARGVHPDVPQFWFPLNMKPETMRKRVLSLFSPEDLE